MRVIPVGYGNPRHRPFIAELMHDERHLLVDTRYSKYSAIPGWHGTSLQRTYAQQYRYFGHTLGNIHYKTPEKGIAIVDLESGLVDLLSLLQDDYTLLLLCGCGTYEKCHRRIIAEALSQRNSEVEILLPEQILAQREMIQRSREDREALYQQLNGIKPVLCNYWSLPQTQQQQVRQEAGKR